MTNQEHLELAVKHVKDAVKAIDDAKKELEAIGVKAAYNAISMPFSVDSPCVATVTLCRGLTTLERMTDTKSKNIFAYDASSKSLIYKGIKFRQYGDLRPNGYFYV